jgi:hypothetical protein
MSTPDVVAVLDRLTRAAEEGWHLLFDLAEIEPVHLVPELNLQQEAFTVKTISVSFARSLLATLSMP